MVMAAREMNDIIDKDDEVVFFGIFIDFFKKNFDDGHWYWGK